MNFESTIMIEVNRRIKVTAFKKFNLIFFPLFCQSKNIFKIKNFEDKISLSPVKIMLEIKFENCPN